MELILTPRDNWVNGEQIRLPWGLNYEGQNGEYIFGRTQRGWFFIDQAKNECSDLKGGDLIQLWNRPYEVQMENPL